MRDDIYIESRKDPTLDEIRRRENKKIKIIGEIEQLFQNKTTKEPGGTEQEPGSTEQISAANAENIENFRLDPEVKRQLLDKSPEYLGEILEILETLSERPDGRHLDRIAKNPTILITWTLRTLENYAKIPTENLDAPLTHKSYELLLKAFMEHVKDLSLALSPEEFTEKFEYNIKFVLKFKEYGETSVSEQSTLEKMAALLLCLGRQCKRLDVDHRAAQEEGSTASASSTTSNDLDSLYGSAAKKAFELIPKTCSVYKDIPSECAAGCTAGNASRPNNLYDVKTKEEFNQSYLNPGSTPKNTAKILKASKTSKTSGKKSESLPPFHNGASKVIHVYENDITDPALKFASQESEKGFKIKDFITQLIDTQYTKKLISKLTSRTEPLTHKDLNPTMLKPGVNLNRTFGSTSYGIYTSAQYLCRRFKHINGKLANYNQLFNVFKNYLIALGATVDQDWDADCPLLKLPKSARISMTATRSVPPPALQIVNHSTLAPIYSPHSTSSSRTLQSSQERPLTFSWPTVSASSSAASTAAASATTSALTSAMASTTISATNSTEDSTTGSDEGISTTPLVSSATAPYNY